MYKLTVNNLPPTLTDMVEAGKIALMMSKTATAQVFPSSFYFCSLVANSLLFDIVMKCQYDVSKA
jgi:hypothetical protein